MRRLTKIISGVTIAAAVATGIYFMARRGGGEEELRTVRAERGEVLQDVSFTGAWEAKQTVELAFEVSGSVTEVTVEVGDVVTAGDTLARLDSRIASLELAKARADVAAAQEQKHLAMQTAEQDWQRTQAENEKILGGKRQMVRNAKIELDQQRTVLVKTDRDSGDVAATATAVLNQRVKESAYKAAQQDLNETQAASAKSNALKGTVADEARAAYEATQHASGRVAGLASLVATEKLAAARLQQTELRAPVSGTVAARAMELGEYKPAGTSVLTLASTDAAELTAAVPEADAAKFTLSALATVTFDALGSREQWQAAVSLMAPAAEIIEGVPTYLVKLSLADIDERLRLGMTANIVVHAAQRRDVVAVPRRAVITRDGMEYVRVKEGISIREAEVTTGLLGSDGRVEIVAGLSGGEEVVLSNGAGSR